MPQAFWEKVDRRSDAECWTWKASKVEGYGWFRGHRAHRWSWELATGPIPTGLHVLHRCDNPSCVNPSHLFLGTHQDNMTDKVAKNRQAHGHEQSRAMMEKARPQSAKLNPDSVREMRRLRESGVILKEIGRRFGVTEVAAWDVVHRRTWGDVA